MNLIDFIAGDRSNPRKVLDQIFGDDGQAERWAQTTLKEHGIDAAADPLDAMKVLRGAEPRLSLKATMFLVDLLNR